jgi:hypothetical protein
MRACGFAREVLFLNHNLPSNHNTLFQKVMLWDSKKYINPCRLGLHADTNNFGDVYEFEIVVL